MVPSTGMENMGYGEGFVTGSFKIQHTMCKFPM